MSLADEIFAMNTRKVVPVEVPEWNKTIHVRSLTAKEQDSYEAARIRTTNGVVSQNLSNMRAHYVALCACDETGKRIFNDLQIEALGEMPVSGVDRVFDAAQKLNKRTDADVKELEKNSGTGPSEGSPSA